MPTVSLNELQGAVDWVSDIYMDNEAFICRQTGKIYWVSGDSGWDDEEEELPKDIHDLEKYLPIPNRYELDIGNRLAFNFAARYLAEQYDDVRAMFRRKGAYGIFKELLAQKDLLDTWYAYSDEQTLIAIKEWCDSEGLAIET